MNYFHHLRSEALPNLLDHLTFLDKNITRPMREYNDCQVSCTFSVILTVLCQKWSLPIIFQEAVKQCYSVEANCYKTKGSKKDKEMIV